MPTTHDVIRKAFSQSKYRWRTAEGIAKDAGLTVRTVRAHLESSDDFVRAKKPNKSGQILYATREKPSPGAAGGPVLKCLVLIPSDPSVAQLRNAIFRVFAKRNIELLSFEERIEAGALWVDGILASLRASDFVIADMTRRNPNVLFELGIAHGIGKPFVLLVSSDSNGDIPSDLLGYQYIAYNLDQPQRLESRLDSFVQHMVAKLGRTL